MNLRRFLAGVPFTTVFDDYPDAYIPELWANESIAILEENMVIASLIHRDFEPIIAAYGDTVNTRKPGEFLAKRKTTADSVTVQTPTTTNVAVILNQHFHTSFLIKDGDQSKSFKDLVVEYLQPAMLSVARAIDQVVSSQVYQFINNGAGHLGVLDGTNADTYLLDTRQKLNINKAYVMGRNLVLSTVAETALLKDKNFTQAYAVGDEGTALREASLGRKYGFDIFMAQNTPFVDSSAQDIVTGAINLSAGYPAGTTSFTVDAFSAAIPAGSWIKIAGDDTPLRVSSTTGGATPTVIVTTKGTKSAVANDAVVTVYKPAQVNLTAGYVSGWAKEIVYDTSVFDPQVGQLVSLTATGEVYGIIEVDTTAKTILLDRPLESALANDDKLFLGPGGSYNFAFHKNAIALVTRPLALPMQGTGARAGIANYNNMSMRVVMTYDGNKQGTLVTLDTVFFFIFFFFYFFFLLNNKKCWGGQPPAQPSSSKNPMAEILTILPQAGAAGAAIIVVWMFLGHVKELVELFRATIEDLRTKFAVDLKDARETFSSELKDTRTSFNDQITQNRNTFAIELQTVTTRFSDRYQSIQDTFKELHTDQIRSSQQTIDTIREIREALKDLREKK